jgi:hypothetical protein
MRRPATAHGLLLSAQEDHAMRTAASVGVAVAAMLVMGGPVIAGTKYQTSLVPNVAGAQPGFSASGSSIKIDGHRSLKGKIKKVVDGTGTLVTTDPANPADDYSIEVDLAVPATALSGTATVAFDVKKGNGTFAVDLSSDPTLVGAVLGDGIAVNGVRVKDPNGTVIGVGGVAFE